MCINPKKIWCEEHHRMYDYPCGKCIDCLCDYQNAWKIRLSHEFNKTPLGVYFTLTYRPESAPDVTATTGLIDEYCDFSPRGVAYDRARVLSVKKSDVVGWLKRCREDMARNCVISRSKSKFTEKGRPAFKYFITAEYGPQSLRPHYHGIFIGMDYRDFLTFFIRDWQDKYGNVDSSAIVYDTGKSPGRCMDYVSKYCSKGFFESPRVAEGSVSPCFKLISKGIGRAYTDDVVNIAYHTGDYHHQESDVDSSDLSGLIDCYQCYGDRFRRMPLLYKRKNDIGEVTSMFYRIYAEPPRDVLDIVVKRLSIVFYDDEKKKVFTYKMPRYYKNRFFGAGSAFSFCITNLLLEQFEQVRSVKLGQIRSKHPGWSLGKAIDSLNRAETREAADKASKKYSSLQRRYGKSKF